MAEKKSAKGKSTKKTANKTAANKSKKAPTKKPAQKTVKKPAEKPPVVKETVKEEQPKKSKKGWLFGIITLVVAAAIGGTVALVLNLNKSNSEDATAKITYTNAFFISDDDKYTLWGADGKRLNEDEYETASTIVGGYSLVKKDGKYGVIKDDGRMSIEFGKYGSIDNRGGLYLAEDGNTKENYLLTGSGKELAKGDKLKTYTSGYTGGFAAVEIGDKIKVFNYNGKQILEVEKADDADDPEVSSSYDFGLFHYANQNFLFDTRDGAVIAKFDGPKYIFDEVSDSRKIVIIENSNDKNKYKLAANGKVYDLDETKYYSTTAIDQVVGYDSYSELALLDENYKVVKKVNSNVELKDTKNHAVETDDGKVEIYQNGNKVKEFTDDAEISNSGIMYEDYYAIRTGDKAMFYNLDGSVGINHEFKDIKTIFDRFHHAAVSDNENEYYFIDAKGNRINDTTFKTLSIRKGGYELKNSDGKYAIANKDGKPVAEFKYSDTYYRSTADPHNIWTGENSSNSHDVIDVENGTVILENANVKDFYTNYFTVKNSEGKTEYYTYGGKLIYTSK